MLQRKFDKGGNKIHEPSLEYEKHRRNIFATIQHMWQYIDFKIDGISGKCANALNDLLQFKMALSDYKL
jgi:hypothetical protein